MRIPFILVVLLLVVASPFFVFANADQASADFFQANITAMNSGQAVTLTWRISGGQGASLLLPCVGGIKYKNPSSGTLYTCDQKIKNLAVADGFLAVIINGSGGTVNVSPTLIPINADGTESTLKKQATFSVTTDPNPITSFAATSTMVRSGNSIDIGWVAPNIDQLNMTMSCTDAITPSIVGDSRPRVPCTNYIFPVDVAGSGTSTFKFDSTSLQNEILTLRLMPKILGTSFYDGTHAKSIDITVTPLSQTRDPVITRFDIGTQTLDSGRDGSVGWEVMNAVGARFRLDCTNSVTATTSVASTTVTGCGGILLTNTDGPSGAFRIALNNPGDSTQTAQLILIPAISTTEFDGVRTRSLNLAVLPGGHTRAVSAAVSQATSSPVIVPQLAALPPPSVPSTSVSLFSKKIKYGMKNDADVKRLQQVLKKAGVFSFDITGNFFGQTEAAVRKFQKKYGLSQVGVVGPQTIQKLTDVANGK